MKKGLRIGFFSFLSFFGLLLLAVVLIWFFPSIAINTQSVKWIAHKQTAVQFEPHFPDRFEIKVQNSKITQQHIHFETSAFCLRTSDSSFRACFEGIALSAEMSFKKFKPLIQTLGPVLVDAPQIQIQPTEQTAEKSDTEVPPSLFADGFRLDEVRIKAPKIELISKESKSNFSLDVTGTGSNGLYDLKAALGIISETDPKSVQALLVAQIQKEGLLTGTLKAHAETKGKKPQIELDSNIQIAFSNMQGELNGKLRLVKMVNEIPLIEVKKFKIAKTEKIIAEGDFDIEFLLESLGNPRKSALPPPRFQTKFSGKIAAEQSGDEPTHFDIAIQPLEQYGMVSQAAFKGTYATETSLLDLENFYVSLKIDRFEKTVVGLKHTQWGIPAPLNELKGPIQLDIGKGRVTQTKDHAFTLPISFRTGLKSTNQSLVTETKGSLFIKTEPEFSGKLKLEAALNDIALQAPDLDPVGKIPNVVGDKRFVQTAVELIPTKKEKSAFTTEISILTPQKPIRIFYDLFKPAAIFRVKSQVDEKKSDFEVKFEPFTVSYLKRSAKLERLTVQNDEATQSIKLDGRFSMQKADYTIFADIHQENKKTDITLTSTPPLSENDIISLILFNELASELDSGSSDSVGNTQSAIAKRSIGFFSFFVLASTPVENVNYDPSTQQYSARVKLPGGFTGSVGSDWDKAQEVGLRKRLGGKWVVSAGFGTDSDGESRQESMIEWFHRY